MAEGPEIRRIRIEPEDARERIDRVVSARTGLSRARVHRLMDAGMVRVVEGSSRPADRPFRKSEPVEAGWLIEVTIPPPEPVAIEPEDLPIRIVFEDAAIAVVDKPAGMVVHPAPGHRRGTLVNALLYHLDGLSAVGGRRRPGIVHRLDRDTSGLLVVAKTDAAHHALAAALKERRIQRLYLAASWGHLSESPARIDAPIGRDPGHRQRMAVREEGRRAVTRVRVRERWQAAELLDVKLETGRTHQIRVHLTHLGHPVVGDPVYGARWEKGIGGPHRSWARELAGRTPRQFLHASRLRFLHPLSGEELRFHSELPDDLREVADWARGPAEEG